MKLNEIRDNPGAANAHARRPRHRLGQGQDLRPRRQGPDARTGVAINGFEGGQMPLHRRLPKRGFTNIFRKDYVVVNLGSCSRRSRPASWTPASRSRGEPGGGRRAAPGSATAFVCSPRASSTRAVTIKCRRRLEGGDRRGREGRRHGDGRRVPPKAAKRKPAVIRNRVRNWPALLRRRRPSVSTER